MASDRPRSKDQVTDPDQTDPRASVPASGPASGPERTDPGSPPPEDPKTNKTHGATRIEGTPSERETTDPSPANADPTRMEAPPETRQLTRSERAPDTGEVEPALHLDPASTASTAPTPADADPTRMEPPPESRPGESLQVPSPDSTRIQGPPEKASDPGTLRTATLPTVRLEVLEGDQPGRFFDLQAGTHVIGRSEEASVCLFDVGASRKHAEISISADGVKVTDLGSGNGTLVNDDAVPEALLQPGDEVRIGCHTFRVHIEGGRGVPARTGVSSTPSLAQIRSTRTRKRGSDRLLILMAVFGAVAVLIAAFALTRRNTVDHGAEQRARHEKANTIFRGGLDAFRVEQWDVALVAFEEAVDLYPGHESAGRYVKATVREKEASAALKDAARLLEANDLAGAETTLSRISPDTVLSEKVTELQRRLDQVKLSGVLQSFREKLAPTDPMLVMEAVMVPAESTDLVRAELELEALEAIDLAAVIEILAEARRRAPEAADISIAQDQLEVRQQAIGSATQAKKDAIAALRRGELSDKKTQVELAIAATMKPVRAAFEAGQFPEAARILKAGPRSENDLPKVRRVVRAARSALKRYQSSIVRAERSESGRELITAGTHFTTAYQAARKISASGKRAREAMAGAVRMRYLAGRTAFNKERWSEAYAQWAKGQRLSNTDENIVKGLADLETKAEAFYLQAYVDKPSMPDRARVGFKLVLKMSPTSSQWNQKARNQLEAMGGH